MILVVLGVLQRFGRTEPLSIFDQPFYLGIAHDLVQDGVFTDGFMFPSAGPDGRPLPGMRFAPLYPGLVAMASRLDGGLRAGMDCVMATHGNDPACPAAAPSVRGVQFLALCGVFWLVWWMGGAVGGVQTGWLALALALPAAPLLLASAGMVMTETLCLALSTAATAAAMAAAAARSTRWAAAAGILLGLAVLTRPAFLYLLPASLAGLLLPGGWRRWREAAAYALAACVVLAPWLLRNWLVMQQLALTRYYGSHTLVQRIAFDTMTWREYGLAYLCWLPDGRGMEEALAGAQACDRFGWDAPNSFYVLGLRHMLPQTLAASGGYAHHLSYLLHTYIFPHPLTHALVSIPLALRGAYVAHWWGLALLPVALGRTVWAIRRRAAPGPAAPFLVLALPAWFMLAFNAAVAVNQVRYNLMLVPVYAVSGAMGGAWLWRRYGWSKAWLSRAA